MIRNGSILVAFALLYAVVLVCGCETDPATAPISITPSTASVREGESVVFQASGGYDYRWSLSDNTIGTLSTLVGPETTYRSISNPQGTAATVQVLTLDSTITGTATTDGSNTVYNASTEAQITHLPEGTNAPVAELRIQANPSNLPQIGDSANITVTGGVPLYDYSLSNDSGRLEGTGANRLYTRTGTNSLNIITVRDSAGTTASVTIDQSA